MTDKELKKLKRNELLELLFYLQREFDELKQENESLKNKIEILENKSLESDDRLSENDLNSISDVVKNSIGNNEHASDNIIESVEELIKRFENSKKTEQRLSDDALVQISEIVKNTYSDCRPVAAADENALNQKDLKSIAVVVNNIMKHYYELNRTQGIFHEKDLNSLLKVADYALNHHKPETTLTEMDISNICEAVKSTVMNDIKNNTQ